MWTAAAAAAAVQQLTARQQKKQKLKAWHDGTLRLHTFNNRMLLYDEARSLVSDKYLKPGRTIDEGDEIEFDQHLVSVDEFLQTVVQDLTPVFAPAIQRHQQRAHTAAQNATSPSNTPSSSSRTSRAATQQRQQNPMGPPITALRGATTAPRTPQVNRHTNGNASLARGPFGQSQISDTPAPMNRLSAPLLPPGDGQPPTMNEAGMPLGQLSRQNPPPRPPFQIPPRQKPPPLPQPRHPGSVDDNSRMQHVGQPPSRPPPQPQQNQGIVQPSVRQHHKPSGPLDPPLQQPSVSRNQLQTGPQRPPVITNAPRPPRPEPVRQYPPSRPPSRPSPEPVYISPDTPSPEQLPAPRPPRQAAFRPPSRQQPPPQPQALPTRQQTPPYRHETSSLPNSPLSPPREPSPKPQRPIQRPQPVPALPHIRPPPPHPNQLQSSIQSRPSRSHTLKQRLPHPNFNPRFVDSNEASPEPEQEVEPDDQDFQPGILVLSDPRKKRNKLLSARRKPTEDLAKTIQTLQPESVLVEKTKHVQPDQLRSEAPKQRKLPTDLVPPPEPKRAKKNPKKPEPTPENMDTGTSPHLLPKRVRKSPANLRKKKALVLDLDPIDLDSMPSPPLLSPIQDNSVNPRKNKVREPESELINSNLLPPRPSKRVRKSVPEKAEPESLDIESDYSSDPFEMLACTPHNHPPPPSPRTPPPPPIYSQPNSQSLSPEVTCKPLPSSTSSVVRTELLQEPVTSSGQTGLLPGPKTKEKWVAGTVERIKFVEKTKTKGTGRAAFKKALKAGKNVVEEVAGDAIVGQVEGEGVWLEEPKGMRKEAEQIKVGPRIAPKRKTAPLGDQKENMVGEGSGKVGSGDEQRSNIMAAEMTVEDAVEEVRRSVESVDVDLGLCTAPEQTVQEALPKQTTEDASPHQTLEKEPSEIAVEEEPPNQTVEVRRSVDPSEELFVIRATPEQAIEKVSVEKEAVGHLETEPLEKDPIDLVPIEPNPMRKELTESGNMEVVPPPARLINEAPVSKMTGFTTAALHLEDAPRTERMGGFTTAALHMSENPASKRPTRRSGFTVPSRQVDGPVLRHTTVGPSRRNGFTPVGFATTTTRFMTAAKRMEDAKRIEEEEEKEEEKEATEVEKAAPKRRMGGFTTAAQFKPVVVPAKRVAEMKAARRIAEMQAVRGVKGIQVEDGELAKRQAERTGYESSGPWSVEASDLFEWKPPSMRG